MKKAFGIARFAAVRRAEGLWTYRTHRAEPIFRDRRSDDRLQIIAPLRGGLRRRTASRHRRCFGSTIFAPANVTRQSGDLPEIWLRFSLVRRLMPDVRSGSWAAVRRNAFMVSTASVSRPSARSDCRPLACHKRNRIAFRVNRSPILRSSLQ
jgi:hypothetical protein